MQQGDLTHLHIHKNDVRLSIFALFRCGQVVQCLPTIPCGRDLEAQFLNSLSGDLLVDLRSLWSQQLPGGVGK